MGRMSDLMIENHNIEQDWFNFLIELLEQSGLGTVNATDRSDISTHEEYEAVRDLPDVSLSPLLAERPTAIELKVYRWKKDWVSHFRAAADHLSSVIRKGDFAGGILVVTLDLERTVERDLFSENAFPVEVWDLSRLRRLVQGNQVLEDKLEELAASTLLDDDRFDWPECPSSGILGQISA